jgi:hypothetical protein
MVDDNPIDHDAESANFLAAYEAGDKQALWQAIIYCAMNRIPAFGWLRNCLYAIDNDAEAGKVDRWDDVFGKPWGKGQQRRARNWAQRFKVHGAVVDEQRRTGQPINNDLFDRVAKKFKFGHSKVGELYAGVKDAIERALRDFKR